MHRNSMKMSTPLKHFLGNLNILDTLWIDTFGYTLRESATWWFHSILTDIYGVLLQFFIYHINEVDTYLWLIFRLSFLRVKRCKQRNFKFSQNNVSRKMPLITQLIVMVIAPLTVLFCNCPLLKDISFNTECLLVWCD